ncbi:MAG: T9SS type A sorting domain-containing protein, partial [Flavobacteriaceae bacterium]|nr:T9SS type A sorting domain-containing protein [Flavobacteriaceae bacterium]
NSNQSITVTPTWTGTVYAEGYSVWIDYNQDGDFTDSGEQVWTQSATTSTPVSGSFTVPTSATEGATRMRVSMKYNAIPTSCESFTYGEVEDYTVNITTSGGGCGSGCSGGITSYPYNEGYENTLGAWTQDTNDDINWTVDASGTPSNNTGPSSASQGTYYIYVEASGNGTGYPNKRAILNSPCFDLSGMNAAFFNFKYHMYGASDMGTIDLEASTDGSSWTSIWSQSGNQGNSWLSVSVDLAAYLGNSVQLRFNRVTGGTWQADVAVDDVEVSTSGQSIDICEGVDPWSSSISYNIGDRVTYQGFLYERTATGWTNLGACGTTNSALYTTFSNAPEFPGSDEISVTIYPNPVSANKLHILSTIPTNSTYSIYNILGQIVTKGTLGASIDVSQLQSGVYILEIEALNNKHITKRFIKE